jgi:hypothetical protein
MYFMCEDIVGTSQKTQPFWSTYASPVTSYKEVIDVFRNNRVDHTQILHVDRIQSFLMLHQVVLIINSGPYMVNTGMSSRTGLKFSQSILFPSLP